MKTQLSFVSRICYPITRCYFFFFSFFGETEISTNWRLCKTKISSHIRETDAKQTPTKQFEEKKIVNSLINDHREQQTTDVHRLRSL